MGQDSIVVIADCCKLDGAGFQSLWRLDFLYLFRWALEPNQPPVQWIVGLFPFASRSRDVVFTTHLHLLPRLKRD
jgi:hypothetical protein